MPTRRYALWIVFSLPMDITMSDIDKLYQTKLAALRSAIIEGETSGDAELFDMDAIIHEAKKEVVRDK
jgi:hypothetical protein